MNEMSKQDSKGGKMKGKGKLLKGRGIVLIF